MAKYKSEGRKIKAGTDLFVQGVLSDELYNLVDGWAFVYALADNGKRQIFHFALPGSLLGYHPDHGVAITYGTQALTDIVVCVVPSKNLTPMIGEDPRISERVAWLTARQRDLAYDHLVNVGRRSAKERIAHILLELYIRSRMGWPGHRVQDMHLPLTQEHLGDATGLTSVHVNRVLRELRDEKILDFRYRRLRIVNPDKLADVSGINLDLMRSWTSHP